MPAWSVGTSPPTTHVPERESEPAQGAGAGEGGGRHGTCTYQIERLADWSMAVSTMPWAKVRGSRDGSGLVAATDRWVEDRRLIRPVRKTFRTRVLCARRDPRALLMLFSLFTGWTRQSGFRDCITRTMRNGVEVSLVDHHRVFGELLFDPLFERLLLLDAQVTAAALPR